jgi:hypothetical protein
MRAGMTTPSNILFVVVIISLLALIGQERRMPVVV